MSDLRKAAEAVLEAWDWDWSEPRNEALRERMEALRQALAQPDQSPLVWMNKYGHVASFQNEEYKDPLYTAPSKREWVGLTKKDLKPLCDQWKIIYGGYVDEFARAIEAKLKEKNT